MPSKQSRHAPRNTPARDTHHAAPATLPSGYTTHPNAGTLMRFHRDALAFDDRESKAAIRQARDLFLRRNGALYHCASDATPTDPSPQWRVCLGCALALLHNSGEIDNVPTLRGQRR